MRLWKQELAHRVLLLRAGIAISSPDRPGVQGTMVDQIDCCVLGGFVNPPKWKTYLPAVD